MFEYLMPLLVMRSLPFTLLDQTYQERGRAADGVCAAREACPGARAKARTTCAIVTRPISTARSASPTWRSSADSAATSSSPRTPRRWPRWSTRARARRTSPARGVWARSATTGSVMPRLHATRTGQPVRLRAHLHGAPHRHDPRRPDQRAAGRPLAATGSTPTRWCSRRSCCCTSAFRAGWRCRKRSPRAPTRRSPTPDRERPVVREIEHPGYAGAARRAARIATVHRDGEPQRQRLQSVRGPGGDAVARRRHPRRHRSVLLHPDLTSGRLWSTAHQPIGAPADWCRARLATRSGHLAARGWRHRDAHRDRGGAGGRRRSATRDADEQRSASRTRSS